MAIFFFQMAFLLALFNLEFLTRLVYTKKKDLFVRIELSIPTSSLCSPLYFLYRGFTVILLMQSLKSFHCVDHFALSHLTLCFLLAIGFHRHSLPATDRILSLRQSHGVEPFISTLRYPSLTLRSPCDIISTNDQFPSSIPLL